MKFRIIVKKYEINWKCQGTMKPSHHCPKIPNIKEFLSRNILKKAIKEECMDLISGTVAIAYIAA